MLYAIAEGWEQGAACRSGDMSLFFSPNQFESKGERLAREAAAKAICRECPVLDPCRERALRDGEIFGVWGGLTEADRRALLVKAGRLSKAG